MTTRSQPIAVRDVLLYLIAALGLPSGESKVYEIGGADVITYRDMMLRYARLRHLKRRVIIVPFFTPRLAQPLILGLRNEVIVRDRAAAADFPQIVPEGFDVAVTRALDRYRDNGPETRPVAFLPIVRDVRARQEITQFVARRRTAVARDRTARGRRIPGRFADAFDARMIHSPD